MTKIVCISDTHGHHKEVWVPYGDILIHAGDFCAEGDATDAQLFLQWMESLKGYQAKILIAGNHDIYPWAHPTGFRKMLDRVAPSVTYLENEGVHKYGLNIYGSPYSPMFGDTKCFMRNRGSDIADIWKRIPIRADILVTHCPPFGFLDLSNNFNEATGKKFDDHLGCRDLRDALYETEPRMHVFGHIHGSGGKIDKYWSDMNNRTILVNASVMDEAYIPNHKAVVVEL